jgi:hypothetical protein
MIRSVKWLGGAAGIIGVVFDLANSYSEIKKGHIKIGVAYLFSAAGGGILTYGAIFSVALSPILIVIAVALILGSAIYLSLNIKNEIQRWLMSCLWRNVPMGESDIPEIWPTSSIEIEAFGKALESGI